jgi:hypothetical protein
MTKYKVTCLSCKESDIHTFDENTHTVVYSDKVMLTPILGIRWRPDLKWGFRCKCGNTNLLAPQEEKDMDKLVAGDPISVKRIAASLKIPDNEQFKMVAV